MNELLNFYNSRVVFFQNELAKTKKRLFTSSMLRLGVFLLAAFLVYFFFGNWKALVFIVLITILIFVFLVSRHSNLQYERDKNQALIDLNKTEIKVLNRDFFNLPDGEEFKNPLHAFSQDIDLFGKKSFFQYLNRTSLQEGKQRLANILTENEIASIESKQAAIAELATKTDFRQEFSAVAGLVNSGTTAASVLKWLSEYSFFVPKFAKWLPTAFSIASAGVIACFFLDFISGMQLLLWFFIGLSITGVYLKKINSLSEKVDKVQGLFQQYHQLLALLETTNFSSEMLAEKRSEIHSEACPSGRREKKASVVLRLFSKHIDALDQRNNLLFGIFGNGFLLWDLRQSHNLEKWIGEYSNNVKKWFEILEFIDAYNSLGNFAHNHPDYVFPKITEGKSLIEAKNAVHPLIDPAKSVKNDFSIDESEFLIITGANMAGKSTFLRTVSLQIVLSNIGLPVCASACEYSPIKLITSMRTSDSLSDEASYFYSELTRLKFIVDQIKTDQYFIVLDEILKGTNSTDKAVGSRKFIEKLVNSGSTGIIATHDLSLCEVAENFPQVKNHYFDAEIKNGELYFDYRFKKGICQNMNASFLLKKMEIVD